MYVNLIYNFKSKSYVKEETQQVHGKTIPGSHRERTLWPGVAEFKSPVICWHFYLAGPRFQVARGCVHGPLLFSPERSRVAWEEAKATA